MYKILCPGNADIRTLTISAVGVSKRMNETHAGMYFRTALTVTANGVRHYAHTYLINSK